MLKIFKKKKNNQTTFCYCPKCRNELISSNSFDKEDGYYTYFKCKKCNYYSMWDFNCPAPILIKKL